MLPGELKNGWLIYWRGDTRSSKKPYAAIKSFLSLGNGRGVIYYAAVVSGADWPSRENAPVINVSFKARWDVTYCFRYPAPYSCRRSDKGVGFFVDWGGAVFPPLFVRLQDVGLLRF